jgi:hypothetical protein
MDLILEFIFLQNSFRQKYFNVNNKKMEQLFDQILKVDQRKDEMK